MTTIDPQKLVYSKFPLEWIEVRDFEHLNFEKSTWIPLVLQKNDILHGDFGAPGYRKAYRDLDSIIVPLDQQANFESVDWQSVSRHTSDAAWADDKGFCPPGSYSQNSQILYPVIQRTFATGDPKHWDLLQELEVGLKVLRVGDCWIAPEEGDVEVARLERDSEGVPDALFFRAEYLRDYLCAKKATLLIAEFAFRDAVEESFPDLNWETTGEDSRRQGRRFEHGWWEGRLAPMHEGGQPFGATTHVLHAWRESVDPTEDVPMMPDPTQDAGMKHKEFTHAAHGKKVFGLSCRIWIKRWISPAKKSPRIRHDELESRIHFQVENQEQATLAGKALRDYRGWLWFKPSVVRRILAARTSELEWYTADTGELGPAPHETLHFGINSVGLLNVLGYKMAELPEWVQKYWVADNVCSEGGLSKELHMAQNLAQPAETVAPEARLWRKLTMLQRLIEIEFGSPLLKQLPSERDFLHHVHRFYCASFADICTLCKEIHRIITERIDVDALNQQIDPANAGKAKTQKLGQIKRLALWLDALGVDGRRVTAPLAGIYELRIADAHAASKTAREGLSLLAIPPDIEDYLTACFVVIARTVNCIVEIGRAVINARKQKASP
jgi:hypothetical protein